MSCRPRFPTEAALVEWYVGRLSSSWAEVPFRLVREFNNSGARADLVVLSPCGDVVVVEAKLRDWRRALNQAYRGTTFAQRAYVLLPEAAASRALQHGLSEFEKRDVGILAVVGDAVVEIVSARRRRPLLSGAAERARAALALD
jgi:hypothetical protein